MKKRTSVLDVAELSGKGHGVSVELLEQSRSHSKSNVGGAVALLNHGVGDFLDFGQADTITLDR